MTQSMLTPLRLRAGIWEGLLTAPTATPRIEALFQGTPLPDLHVTALPDQPGCHIVKLVLPSTLISDGVQTVILRDAETLQPAWRLTTTCAPNSICCGQSLIF